MGKRVIAIVLACVFCLEVEAAHLKISGTRFIKPDGTTFQWRGISAFRLLEFVAHGNEKQADGTSDGPRRSGSTSFASSRWRTASSS